MNIKISAKSLVLFFPLIGAALAQPVQAGAPSQPPTAVQVASVQSWSPIRNEHVQAARPVGRSTHLVDQFPASAKPVGGAARIASAPRAASASNAFLTRPYMNYHMATSIFDHCNPDYSVDGRVCAEDGTVGLSSNGVDPSFSKGYAATRGGSDYVYYDGHNGWDMALNYENVMAAADGVVKIAGIDSQNTCFGQNVVIDHPNGFSTRYAHLSQIYVSVGQNVSRGTVIGQSGNTGCSSGPHLHFGVYVTNGWNAIDPFGWDGAPGADPWPYDQGDLWLTGNPANPLPTAPSNVVAVAGNRSALVSWQAPQFDGGSGIANYAVTSNPGGITVTVPGSQTSATVSGLTTGTTYTFSVMATNGLGAVSASTSSNSIVPISVPGPPLSVSAVPGNRSITVKWNPPTLDGGSPITSYTVSSLSGGLSTTVSTGTTATFAGLTSFGALRFQVTAVNANGAGLPSDPSNSTAAYPVNQLFTLEGFGGVHADAATAAMNVSAYWPNWKIARSGALLPDGSGGYVLDGFGGIHGFGQAAAVTGAYWPSWDIARDLALLPTSTAAHAQGYVLEGFGGLHPFGGAPAARLSTYWSNWDIARRVVLLSDGTGGYVMDAYGGLHPFAVGTNAMPPAITNFAYWPGWQIARDVTLQPGSTAANVAGVTLDGFGGVHPFGSAGAVTDNAYWSGWDIARSVQFSAGSTAAHPQGWVLEGYGGLHPFGGAPSVPGAFWQGLDLAVKLIAR